MQTKVDLLDGTLVVQRTQDCTPIAETMKALHNEGHHGSSEMRFLGRIPNVLIEAYCNTHGVTYEEFCSNHEHKRRLLNDPAVDAFRVWKGRV